MPAKKTAKQLDDEIAESLRDEARRLHEAEALRKLDPHQQEVVLRAQEISALREELEAAGLGIKFPPREIVASGNTYPFRNVLKKFGFRFKARDKSWRRPTDYAKNDLDYLAFYNALLRNL